MTLKKLFDDKYIGYHTFGLKINCKLKDLNIEHDYSKDYFTIEALEDGNIYFKYQEWSPILTQRYMEYSKDGGKTWIRTTNVDNEEVVMTIPLTAGKMALIRGDNDTLASYNESEDSNYNSFFYSDTRFNVYGNIMSLIHGNDFIGKTTVTNYMFLSLFYDSYGANYSPFLECLIVNAENLILPATTLAISCYANMFYNCTSLTTSPELPATILSDNCYELMFCNCTSLTTAPKLPAITLAQNCYSNMFYGCTLLITTPELPATTLAQSCYSNMFSHCTGLTTTSKLPATTLANYCYLSMFVDCTSLITTPELPATTLAPSCYINMFVHCTSLTTAPELPATILTDGCYLGMFSGCSSLTTAPELPATTLENKCYIGMFRNCSRLNYIKAMFTTSILNTDTYTKDWVNGVSSAGIFVKNSSLAGYTIGNNGIPPGWTEQTADE